MRVELIDHMGSDLSVVNAARVSFDKESAWEHPVGDCPDFAILKDSDKRLIAFLARENHWSPFSHTSLSFRISAPIFVARQLGKHQVGLSWNEVSRRYVDSDPEFYEPPVWRKRAADKKQGSAEEPADYPMDRWRRRVMEDTLTLYNSMIHEGVCPEQARMVLPQSMMTEWIWTGSLYAFARVCNLRLKPDTQAETRVIARGIAEEAARLFPVSWAALIQQEG